VVKQVFLVHLDHLDQVDHQVQQEALVNLVLLDKQGHQAISQDQ
jgi:hypothetical protein